MVARCPPQAQSEDMHRAVKWSGAGAVWAAAAAAAAQPVPPALEACTHISAEGERLACFDREMSALSKVATAGAGATPLTPEQKLGLSPEGVRKLETRQGMPADKSRQELTARLTSVARNPAGREVFTLDNGQVWRQAESRARFEAHAGEAVKITPGALGSFWLSTGTHNWTRVERVP
jgi:hypothetical protein